MELYEFNLVFLLKSRCVYVITKTDLSYRDLLSARRFNSWCCYCNLSSHVEWNAMMGFHHQRRFDAWKIPKQTWQYSIFREICTRFLLCCALLWLYIDWFFPYPSGLLHWHCGNLTIAPVPAKQPWWIWINISCEFIMNDCITTTKQSTTKPCAYFLGYTVDLNLGLVNK